MMFGKWNTNEVNVEDPGLKDYINLVAASGGSHAKGRFWKAKTPLVERLINKMMVTGHLREGRVHRRVSGRDTGKKLTAYSYVKKAFEIIEKKTNQNPIQVLVNAVENVAPVEETTAFRQGGIIARRPVDVSPERRLDISLRFISHGAAQRAFKTRHSIEQALAEEIMAAAKYDTNTYCIKKKEEIERIAGGAK